MNEAARLRWIDVVRATACIAVLLHHAVAHLHAGGPDAAAAPLAVLGLHGWLGVPVFFVLSGYCISESISRRASSSASGALAFWLDRALRIYPVFWVAFVFACVLAVVATLFNGTSLLSAWPPTFAAALADLSLTSSWFGQPTRLLVAWSLHYEIAFYLVAGVTLLPGLRSPARRLCVIAGLTLCVHLNPDVFEFTPLGLWPHFACGCLVHFALRSNLPIAVRLACLAYPCAALGFDPDAAQLAATVTSLALAVLFLLDKTLPAPPSLLVKIGLASYSIYLVHVPLISPLNNLALRFVPLDHPGQFVLVAASLFLGLTGGMLFYRWIERPLETLRKGIPSNRSAVQITPLTATA